ncbi:MAG TPA: response regulator [Syntrophomonadaceae bacterium]|nr:response regulator [Syntrophomonadaceae bacterium]HPR93208.1 response regulator [Syntrophomonadaceae bacterium]
MILQHFKRWAFLYATLVILLKSLADIYCLGATTSLYYAIISSLFFITVTLIILLFPLMNRTAEITRVAEHNFLANLSHEFRTPMTGIIGAADLIEQENLTSAQFDHLEIIKKAGYNLLNIVDNILDLNKLELGQTEINLKPFSLKNIISYCTFKVSSSLKAKGLNLNIHIAEDANIMLMLDEQKFKQIILTLLSKAIENTESGTILLKVWLEKESASHLLLSIAYKGIYAKAPAQNPLLGFNNCSPVNEFADCLGLYFCQQLTEFLGGKFWTCCNSDQNIVFQLYLPADIIAAEQINKSEDDSDNIAVKPFMRLKVLLVEDNAFNVKILSQMLHNYGFEVTTAENGLQCLQILQDNIFDVILMDMQMPVMDGYEASRIIKSDPDLRSMPVIAVTANAMIGDWEKCLASGCTSYLAKPFQARELINEIEKVLQDKKIFKINPDSIKEEAAIYDKEFLSELDRSIIKLEEASEKNDWELIKALCYEIKALAGMYTCKDIYHQASLIEVAASKKMAKIINLSVIELKKYFSSLIRSDIKTGTSLE